MQNNQIVALIVNIFILFFIINSIKKGKLKEKFALFWILSSICFIAFSVWFSPIEYLATVLGIADPLNLLYMIGAIFLIFVNLQFSFSLSKKANNYKSMAQRIALLEDRLSKHQDIYFENKSINSKS